MSNYNVASKSHPVGFDKHPNITEAGLERVKKKLGSECLADLILHFKLTKKF